MLLKRFRGADRSPKSMESPMFGGATALQLHSRPPMPLIRPASAADLSACRDIYAHHVLNGVGTFEEIPPSGEEFAQRFAAVAACGLPWLAAERDGRVVGYVYASAYLIRSAYRFTVQDSIYVAPDATGAGVGRGLLNALVGRCETLGFRRMVAIIGGSENAGSRGLHRACGFSEVGILPAVGLKFGRWLDGVLMQRPLGEGGDSVPTRDPAARLTPLR